jgi:hypothetical protein
VHDPQSDAQLVQVSPVSQVPLPQTGGQGPQSELQLVQVSPVSQVPLPQTGGQGPQSELQLVQSSPVSHVPLPQVAPPHVCPQTLCTSPTQMLSQLLLQQYGSTPQI